MTSKLGNLVLDEWVDGDGDGNTLISAVNGEPVAQITSDGLDFADMLQHARNVGGANLRKLTFHERGEMLKALAQYLMEHKKEFYRLSTETGATRSDSWVDIEGGISTLFVFSSKARREMPNDHVYLDGPPEQLSKNGTFLGQHIYTPKLGAAVHINAFNFPCWGMLEKLGPALIAGVPAIVKPASSTAYLTELMVRRIHASGILPDGALQLICGGVGNLFDHLNCQDTIAFTGSKNTAEFLQAHPRVVSESVAFTAETDSLNSSILGPDALPGTPEFDLYVQEVTREMTAKAGQKCTAIRRIIAPASFAGELVAALAKSLGEIRIGNPASKDVDMGALASQGQRDEVRDRVKGPRQRAFAPGGYRLWRHGRVRCCRRRRRQRRVLHADAVALREAANLARRSFCRGVRSGQHGAAVYRSRRGNRIIAPWGRQPRRLHRHQRQCGGAQAGAGNSRLSRPHGGHQSPLRRRIDRPRFAFAAPRPRRTGACRGR
jgi:oxepin-CoA hydrolase/3-oxo-5,6-dehydrosuberyl-CoA semialdehyde dehydrogenase